MQALELRGLLMKFRCCSVLMMPQNHITKICVGYMEIFIFKIPRFLYFTGYGKNDFVYILQGQGYNS